MRKELARSVSARAPLATYRQHALDAAAEDARSIAGSSYFTAAALNQDANTVDVYLKSAPQSVIDQLTARHPGVYVIHNDAPNTEATLLKLTDAFDKTPLQEKGIRVTGWGPTRDGYLQVGVTADVATAQSILDKLYGPNVIRVYQSEPATPAGYRYADSGDWNGGDFIGHNGSGTDDYTCTSGIPVHKGSTYYMLTASHCFWKFGRYVSVRNTMFESDGTVYPGSSQELIGSVSLFDDITDGSTTHDSALIPTPTDVIVFHGVWNGTGTATQIGNSTNELDDLVCTSGAFEGEVCGLKITALNQTLEFTNDNGGTYSVHHLAVASDPNSTTSIAAGQGDSGGPVYKYSGSTNNILARGMIDAISDYHTCTSNPTGWPAGTRVCGHVVYFVQLGSILNEWGLTVNS